MSDIESTKRAAEREMPDVFVIGAGVVGHACAWAALHEGLRVTLIDRDFEGDHASHGNAGGIAVTESTPIAIKGMFTQAAKWLMDPLGPLSLDWKHVPSALPWFMAFRRAGEPSGIWRSRMRWRG